MHDEWGRPVSPDGAWVWDGAQWLPRQQPAAPGWSAQQGQPSDGLTAAAVPHAASVALEAEVQRYPRLWRIARQGVLRIADHLEPGEVVQATAPGSGDLIAPAISLIAGSPTAQRSMVVVATDRRLLLCQLTLTSRDVASAQGLPYAHVERWRARKRSLEIEGAGVQAYPNQMVKDLLLRLRAVVEPRLANAHLDVR